MNDSFKHIAVLVSAGKHPVSGQARHSRNDSLALQLGLNLVSDIKVLHAGEPDNPALQDYFALGAPQIDVVPTSGDIVENLAAQLTNTDLILTGMRAENGEDSGLLPYLLAAKLNLPIVADALEITPRENQLEILQFLPKGQRRRVLVSLPALVAVHPSAAVMLNFIHARQNLGSISNLPASNTVAKPSQWRLEKARKPIKLAASAKLTGHERLMAAISSKAKGGAVVNEGNNVEKAQVILAYLREHQLIDF
jgi:electron transfer flavoprotein beta subunit